MVVLWVVFAITDGELLFLLVAAVAAAIAGLVFRGGRYLWTRPEDLAGREHERQRDERRSEISTRAERQRAKRSRGE